MICARGPFPAPAAYPTLRKEREGWGTRASDLAQTGGPPTRIRIQAAGVMAPGLGLGALQLAPQAAGEFGYQL